MPQTLHVLEFLDGQWEREKAKAYCNGRYVKLPPVGLIGKPDLR